MTGCETAREGQGAAEPLGRCSLLCAQVWCVTWCVRVCERGELRLLEKDRELQDLGDVQVWFVRV